MKDFIKSYTPAIDVTLAAAVGFLTTEWAGAQFFLVRVLAELMVGKSLNARSEGDFTHAMSIIGMDARVLIGLTRTTARARLSGQMADEIDRILNRMETAKKLRDLVDHCIWELQNGKLFALSLKTVGTVKRTRQRVTEKDIFVQISILHDCANQFLGYLHSAGYMKSYEPSLARPY